METNKEILENVYQYKEKASYTPEDLELAKEMFSTPERFALLRKVLQVLTQEERGISIPSKEALIAKRPEDLTTYGLQVAIESLADEKVRQTLVSFYMLLKGTIEQEKKDAQEEKEKLQFEEEKRTEEFKEKRKVEERKVGPNL